MLNQPYQREFEVVMDLASQAHRLWPSLRSARLAAERGYGLGVADLVITSLDSQAMADRIRSSLSPTLSAAHARLLEMVPSVSIRRSELFELASWSPRHTARLASDLVSSGHLVDDGGGFRRHPSVRPLSHRVIAIEAKLSDWTSGLRQVRQYLEFADQVYLAVPAAQARNPERDRRSFMETGVGLVAVGRRSRILVRAPLRRPRDPGMRRWLDEAELGIELGTPRRLISPFPPQFAAPSPGELVPSPMTMAV